MNMIYLATPYWHEDPIIREQRYLEALKCVHWHMPIYYLYSPIVYYHTLSKIFDLPKGEKFWRHADEAFLRSAKAVWFAKFPGWKRSKGMKREYLYCLNNNKSIFVLVQQGDMYYRTTPMESIYDLSENC